MLTSRLIDRPIRPLFPSGWRYETQIIALVMSADTDNDADVLAITGASAALAISEIPFEKTIAGVRVGLVNGAVRHQPDLRRAQGEPARPDRRRHQGRHRDGGSRRQAGARSPGRRRARSRARRHQADRRRHRRAEGRRRQAEARRRRPRRSRPSSISRSRRRHSARSTDAMRIKEKLESYATGRPGAGRDDGVAAPSADAQQKKDADHIFHELQENVMREEALEKRRPPRRPQVRRDPPDLDRDRRAAARPRLGRLHARRDAGAGHLHARHGRRPAEDRARHRRVLQALHAPLQLPAVLGRRDRAAARARPPRDRSRRARRARAGAGRSRPKTSSPTRSASCRTSSSRTARRRWRRCAAARWR